ncbi:unnamed protein product [Absidia cylindrospora]
MKTVTALMMMLGLVLTTLAQQKPVPTNTNAAAAAAAKICGANEMPVNGKCQQVKCSGRAAICLQYQKYCISNNLGTSNCFAYSGLCECDSYKTRATNKKMYYCEKHADCPGENKNCLSSRYCLIYAKSTPSCIPSGNPCAPKDPKKKCCDGTFCHTRYGPGSYSCVSTAFVREKCGSSNKGIPCEVGSTCLNGKCALRRGDGCDAADSVCSPGLTCKHVAYSEGVNKECL